MFTLIIKTANAAFEDDPTEEIARILFELSDVVSDVRSGSLFDSNGNRVGSYEMTEDDE